MVVLLHERLAFFSGAQDLQVHGNGAQERNVELLRHLLAAVGAEDVCVKAAPRATKAAHVLDDADDPHAELPAESDGASNVLDRDLLWRGDDDRPIPQYPRPQPVNGPSPNGPVLSPPGISCLLEPSKNTQKSL